MWSTPPRFSYPYPASVDDLNILKQDAEYLYGLIYSTVFAIPETETEVESPFEGEKTASRHWIVHTHNNLYYRIRVTSEHDSHSVGLWLHIYDVDDNEQGSGYEEEQTLTTAGTYYVFNNSGSAIDISGLSLTVGDWYYILVKLDATNYDNENCDVEVDYISEDES